MTLSIGELVDRTGVAEGTLRMWEQRHGFPVPRRLPSGHRRYSEADVEAVRGVMRERAAGLSLAAAIARVREAEAESVQSIFAGMRRARPELQPIKLRKPVLLALSRAIEDESCALAERPLLFGSFQRERFYRASQRRWRDFARTARVAVVFADFPRRRTSGSGPAELPVDRSGPLSREWAIVCEARGHAVCLAGVELPTPTPRTEPAREFDVIWSVEPEVVRSAVDVCVGLVRESAPKLVENLNGRVGPPPPEDQLRLAAAITARTLGAVSR